MCAGTQFLLREESASLAAPLYIANALHQASLSLIVLLGPLSH